MTLNFGTDLFGRNRRVSIISLTDGTPLHIDAAGDLYLASGAYMNIANEVIMASGAYVNMGSEVIMADGSTVNIGNDVTLVSGAYVNMGSEVIMASGSYVNISSDNTVKMTSGAYVNFGDAVTMSDIGSGAYVNFSENNSVTLVSGGYVNLGDEVVISSGAYVNIADSTELNVASGAYVNITSGDVDIANAYIENFMEYSGKNQTQIMRRAEISEDTTTTMYTVPSGKNFFLTNANACMSITANDSQTGVQIEGTPDGTVRHLLKIGVASDAGNVFPAVTEAHSYVPAIKFQSGAVVQLESGGGTLRGYGNVQGWIEDA